MIPSILNSIAQIADPTSGLKIAYSGISYKPFISLFNMTGAAEQNPQLAGIVNYASALVLEIRSSEFGPIVQMKFKNGTDDVRFNTYRFLGSGEDTVGVDKVKEALAVCHPFIYVPSAANAHVMVFLSHTLSTARKVGVMPVAIQRIVVAKHCKPRSHTDKQCRHLRRAMVMVVRLTLSVLVSWAPESPQLSCLPCLESSCSWES